MLDLTDRMPVARGVASAPLERVAQLLCAAGSAEAVVPPTALYNEGWMLRLVLDWFDQNRATPHALQFLPGAIWRSEALLATQFRARGRGDRLAESWTHADGVIGHLRPAGGRGDAQLAPDAKQFMVVEAKMCSGLSAGTTRAATFDQAARNVACVVESVRLAGRGPDDLSRLAWVLLAPDVQIRSGVFGELCSRPSIEQAIRRRVEGYGGEKETWLHDICLPLLERIDICVLSWESVLDHIASMDNATGPGLNEFYQQCLRFNLPRERGPRR